MRITSIAVSAILLLSASIATAQDTIENTLRQIESNSKELKARRELTNTQKLEVNTGRFLANPTVEYSHEWGSPSSLGTSGELVVKQQFDFPTSYANKNKVARLKEGFYNAEDAGYRQDYLLAAKLLCVELVYLNQQRNFLAEQVANTESMSKYFASKMKAGDANILEVNKVEVERINAQTALNLNQAAADNVLMQLQQLNGGLAVNLSATAYPQYNQHYTADSITRLTLDSNPAIKSLVAGIDVAKSEVSLSKSMALPKFEVGYRQNITSADKFRGVVVGMSIPLFENKNTVKRAKAQQQLAETQLESQQAKLANEVSKLYQQAVLLNESANKLRSQLAQLNAVALLNKALNLGEISVTSYFVEISSLYQSRQTLLDIEREYQRNMAMLYRFEL